MKEDWRGIGKRRDMIGQQFILKNFYGQCLYDMVSIETINGFWVGTGLTLLLVVSNLYADNRHLWGVYQSQDLTIKPHVDTCSVIQCIQEGDENACLQLYFEWKGKKNSYYFV